jgi:hypothetical protein
MRGRRTHYTADSPDEQRLLQDGLSLYRQAPPKSDERKDIVAQYQYQLSLISPHWTPKKVRTWFNNAMTSNMPSHIFTGPPESPPPARPISVPERHPTPPAPLPPPDPVQQLEQQLRDLALRIRSASDADNFALLARFDSICRELSDSDIAVEPLACGACLSFRFEGRGPDDDTGVWREANWTDF